MDLSQEKRKVKIVNKKKFNLNEVFESTDDSDFRIEDHYNNSDSSKESKDNSSSKSSELNDCQRDDKCERKNNVKESDSNLSLKPLNELITMAEATFMDVPEIKVCCICLESEPKDSDKIVECLKCKILVHKDCYRILANKKKPEKLRKKKDEWFCESCKSAVYEPSCELCPNLGGAFKETDNGKWVHLVCALYMPEITFGNRDSFSNVKMSKVNYKKWSEKVCILCEDVRYCRTGICIGCDAGLCRTYFHVTCAQRLGLLVNLHYDDPDENQPDPFYAHCKLHADKQHTQRKRRNWIIFRVYQEENRNKIISQSILSKLHKIQQSCRAKKESKIHSWSFKMKCPKLLLSKASICRTLYKKAELKEIRLSNIADNDNNLSSNFDLRRKCAFSANFVNYYFERDKSLSELRSTLITIMESNNQYIDKHKDFMQNFEHLTDTYSMHIDKNNELRESAKKWLDFIAKICPNKPLPNLDKDKIQQEINLGVLFNMCHICKEYLSQHLLVKCDKCSFYYHLDCLDPPLKRYPKKSRIVGWQCSNCDPTESLTPPGKLSSNIRPRTTKSNLKRRLDFNDSEESNDSCNRDSVNDTENLNSTVQKRPRKLSKSKNKKKV